MAKICVFCSASEDLPEDYLKLAREMGTILGQRGHHLVYGGSNLGLMGEVSRAFAKHGGEITEIIPEIWSDIIVNKENAIITKDIQERLAKMITHSDGFIALPGGIGTMHEIYTILVEKQVSQLDKPLTLLNIGNLFEHHINHLKKLTDKKMLGESSLEHLHITQTPEEALSYIEENIIQ
jgi:uncharacterized protein (TIGR00730 family)